ncbi:MAG: DUF4272 domain-containing protein [Paludisphaera borealis]|uniref:DUF4272 domain-containing protein n=1 Tax=Paludisphaera borealis TaxID=1387353 RepID=UPI002848A7DC|nr:DUF4272 domain-containing protein [Paludisphaera borealis]MDR3621269.1 DUF4272 domain-containing protein [Paludisphaera borealis]
MTAEALRVKVFADLEAVGFRPAKSLPDPDLGQSIRPPDEIAARLLALDSVFTWAAFSEVDVASDRIEDYIDRNGLRDWLAEDERAIVALPRTEAHESHADTVGWRLENMWALAWVLGFDPEPTIEANQIGDDVVQAVIYDFLPGLGGTVDALLAKARPRSIEDVIALEYRFYCAHNAVRSAQLGRKTVPKGFHPVVHGGAIHERRHALSWCLAPGVDWDDVDLST